jgi:pilus assembly protein CpaE
MIILADPDRKFRTSLLKRLGRQNNGVLHAGESGQVEQMLTENSGDVDVLLLGPHLAQIEALGLAEKIQLGFPEVSSIMIAAEVSPDLLHSALRAGVKDVIPATSKLNELADAVTRGETLSRQFRDRGRAPESAKGLNGKLVTVFSSKGGSGKSFLSSNLAVLLAATTGKEVALVDLDLQSGDLAIMFQLMPEWTIHDAAENIDRLDAEGLRAHLTQHRSGIFLLAAPVDPALAEGITPQAIQRILTILRSSFSYVVVDGPPLFTDQLLAALDESDESVLVGSMDVPSIKNLRLALQTFDQLEFKRNQIRIVLNRADSDVGLRVKEVEKTIGTRIDIAVPSDREVPLSVNKGIPLAMTNGKSAVVAAITKLAQTIATSPKPKRRQPQAAAGASNGGLH